MKEIKNTHGGQREGSGRKCKGENPRVQFSCLISKENKSYICQMAKETGLSNSDVINTIIDINRDENR